MTRFYGEVGYGSPNFSPDTGVSEDEITEVQYYGDVVQNRRRLQDASTLHDDIVLDNSISIVADQYAMEHAWDIKYVRWNGVVWNVSSVDMSKPPRLIMSLGSVYNGPQA